MPNNGLVRRKFSSFDFKALNLIQCIPVLTPAFKCRPARFFSCGSEALVFRRQLGDLPVFLGQRLGMCGIDALVISKNPIVPVGQVVVLGNEPCVTLLIGVLLLAQQIRSLHFPAMLKDLGDDVTRLLLQKRARYKLTV